MLREALMAIEHVKLIWRATKRARSLKGGIIDHVLERSAIREAIPAWRKGQQGRWGSFRSDGVCLWLDGVELPIAVLLCPKCVDMVALGRGDFGDAVMKMPSFWSRGRAIAQYWAMRMNHDGCITVEGNVICDIDEQVRRGRKRQTPCAVCARIGKEKLALMKLRATLALLGHEMAESIVTQNPPVWKISTKDGALFYLPFEAGADPYDEDLINTMCDELGARVSMRPSVDN